MKKEEKSISRHVSKFLNQNNIFLIQFYVFSITIALRIKQRIHCSLSYP